MLGYIRSDLLHRNTFHSCRWKKKTRKKETLQEQVQAVEVLTGGLGGGGVREGEREREKF